MECLHSCSDPLSATVAHTVRGGGGDGVLQLRLLLTVVASLLCPHPPASIWSIAADPDFAPNYNITQNHFAPLRRSIEHMCVTSCCGPCPALNITHVCPFCYLPPRDIEWLEVEYLDGAVFHDMHKLREISLKPQAQSPPLVLPFLGDMFLGCEQLRSM